MHLAKMYQEYEPVIKELFSRYKAEGKFTYVQAFADMLMAPKLYESVAKSIIRK